MNVEAADLEQHLRNVVVVAAIDNADKLLSSVRERTTGRHAVEITVGRSHIAFALSHAFVDGTSGSKLMAEILANAQIGGVGSLDPSVPEVSAIEEFRQRIMLLRHSIKSPIAAAIWNLQLYRPTRMKLALEGMRSFELSADEQAPLEELTSGAPAQVRQFKVEISTLNRYRTAILGPGSARQSLNSIITADILNQLALSVPATHAMAVAMPIDCRRFVRNADNVDGNFAPAVCIGRLHEVWTAQLANDRIARALEIGAPVAVMLRGIRHGSGSQGTDTDARVKRLRRGQTVTISHIRTDANLNGVIERMPFAEVGTTGKGRARQGISIRTERAGGFLHITITDDSELVDCSVFENGLKDIFDAERAT